MRKTISIVAAAMTAAPIAVSSALTVQASAEIQASEQHEQQQHQEQHRQLGWGSSSSSSSSKSGKSSSSGGSSHDGGYWGPPPGWWGSSFTSGKSGKSGSSKSSKGSSSSHDGWWGPPPGWGWDSSSSSGKSSKGSSKGSKGSSSSHDSWWGPPGWGWDSSSSSGKSSKGSSKSSKGSSSSDDHRQPWGGGWDNGWGGWDHSSSGKSGKSGSSGKSGKGSSSDDHNHGHWHWNPWWSSSSSKSGKSKGSKSKSGKGSKSSKGSSSGSHDGWSGGWGSDEGGWKWVSGSHDGWSSGGQWGSGDGGWYYHEHSHSHKSSTSVDHHPDTPSPTEWATVSKPAPKPAPKPEPAPAPKPEPKPEGLKTICFHEGEIIDCSLWGGDGHGKDWGGDGHSGSGDWADDGHGDDDKWADDGHDADDDEWTNDGHSGGKGEDDDEWNGDGHNGGEFSVAFTYTVNTDGKSDPEDLITPALENAILDDVAAYIEDSEDYSDFSGKISAKPEDYIAGDEYCGDGKSVRCSVVKGEMTIYDDNGSFRNACEASGVIEDAMDGQDYSEDVDGVDSAEYRNSDEDCGKIIAGAATVVEEKNELSAGAAFGILFAAAALLALALLIYNKLRRKPQSRQAIPLISNNLDGSPYGDNRYGNTIDVHKCTSIYCNCNKGLDETAFLPAPSPRTSSKMIAKSMAAHGISPTAVDEAPGFNEEEAKEEEDARLDTLVADPDLERQSARGSIMRVPILSQLGRSKSGGGESSGEEVRSLSTVNEVAHDSDIDTENEGDELDETSTVPPPPPLAFHPGYDRKSGNVEQVKSDDEASI